jgi:predicted transposase/invertase (TIGR01784 family)
MSKPMNTHPVRYLDPKIDLAFKRVFGQNIDLLKSFLNALLPLPEDAPIESLEYLSAEHAPDLPLIEKYSIVDVKCKDAKGRIFIVEMQMLWSAYFGQRVLFGGSQAYVKQLGRAQDYSLLQPVYALALINSIYEPDSPDYYHHYKIIKVGQAEKTLKGLEFVFIELPKFKAETKTDKKMMRLWLRFLNEIGSTTEQTPDIELQNQADISKAMDLMQVSAFNEAELNAYNHSLDEWRTTKLLLNNKLFEGCSQRELEIAKALKLQGVNAAVIMAATALTAADIDAL